MQATDIRTISRNLERWFLRHQRNLPWRQTYDPYHVWVSEIMLQQTRMEVVLPYFERFLTLFPNVAALACASEDAVLSVWSGLGYYRRARMLREGAEVVVERFSGKIPSSVEELLTIPGIGRYTAGAIASVAWNRRAPIVDGNVTRVLSRVFALDGDLWECAGSLVHGCKSPRTFNQGLMELGALICKPRNPVCLLCPLRDQCVALATGRIDELPKAKVKKATRELHIPLYVVRDRRGHVLMRRVSGTLMSSMFHLPHGDTSLLDGEPLAATPDQLLGTFRHTVTTRRIEFAVWSATFTGRGRRGYEWIDPANMDSIPHSSYVKKALRIAAGTEEHRPA
ncbi:MAG: A/G-specific adenine glycosylase [Acidobacteriota bacterium]